MPEFIPGLKLSRLFYEEAVRPIIEAAYPGMPYSTGLLGHGSDVLGLDDEQSTDHFWGPRLLLFIPEDDFLRNAPALKDTFGLKLPRTFHGYPTHFVQQSAGDPPVMQESTDGSINHLVQIFSVKSFCEYLLGIGPEAELDNLDWLTLPQQELLALTAGEVFCDGLGTLERVRRRFHYFPDDIWKYLLSCQWQKIAQEEAFPGRCAESGDELGTQIITARLVREMMRLCFLIEQVYYPYNKWLGSMFSRRLSCGAYLGKLFNEVLQSYSWPEKEKYLSQAYEAIGEMQNSLGYFRKVEAKVSRYFDRPYQVIRAERFAAAAREAIRDERMRSLPVSIGSIDQFIDSTDFLMDTKLSRRARLLFEELDR